MKAKYKIDLHTHSRLSKDGGISDEEYLQLLDDGVLDVVAVTDHNQVAMALELYKERPEKIIVGEEIMTREGEIIGLYLQELVPAGLGLAETIGLIHAQGGLVYIPHPFDPLRHGISEQQAMALLKHVDIWERFNARYITVGKRKGNEYAREFGIGHKLPLAASSDSHSRSAIGKTYAIVEELPTRETLTELLRSAEYVEVYANLYDRLVPGWNWMRKLLHLE